MKMSSSSGSESVTVSRKFSALVRRQSNRCAASQTESKYLAGWICFYRFLPALGQAKNPENATTFRDFQALSGTFFPAIARKMVLAVGFEPTFRVFSLLLIVAFLCAGLYALIQVFPSYSKHYFASIGNFGQENLCGNVLLCGNCADTGDGLNLCGNCAALPGSVIPRELRAPARASRCLWCVRVTDGS
jgi:hypothetical protein